MNQITVKDNKYYCNGCRTELKEFYDFETNTLDEEIQRKTKELNELENRINKLKPLDPFVSKEFARKKFIEEISNPDDYLITELQDGSFLYFIARIKERKRYAWSIKRFMFNYELAFKLEDCSSSEFLEINRTDWKKHYQELPDHLDKQIELLHYPGGF